MSSPEQAGIISGFINALRCHCCRRSSAAATALLSMLIAVALGGCSETTTVTRPSDKMTSGVLVNEPSLTRVPPAERKPAPVASGPKLGGGEISTADYPGKVIVLNVWGSWCAPCRKEAKDLQRASEKTKGVAQFIGINTRDLDPAPAQAFVRAFGVTYPHLFDPQGEVLLRFAGDLPANAIPTTLVIDKEGRVAARVIGTMSELTLIALIEDIEQGT